MQKVDMRGEFLRLYINLQLSSKFDLFAMLDSSKQENIFYQYIMVNIPPAFPTANPLVQAVLGWSLLKIFF